jgi:hypothetical protein
MGGSSQRCGAMRAISISSPSLQNPLAEERSTPQARGQSVQRKLVTFLPSHYRRFRKRRQAGKMQRLVRRIISVYNIILSYHRSEGNRRKAGARGTPERNPG